MRGEPIERLLDEGVVDERCRPRSQAIEPRGALTVAGKQTMDAGADHASARRDGAFGYPTIEPRKWTRPVATLSDAHVHFVAFERNSVAGGAARHRESLFIVEHGIDVEQTEPCDGAWMAFDAVGIRDGAAEHLVAAAQPQHHAAAPYVRHDVDV